MRFIDFSPDGNLWVGTDQGASRFDGVQWTTLTTSDGLADNRVNSIAFSPDNTVWFATNGGISKYDGVTWTTLVPKGEDWSTRYIFTIAVAPDSTVYAGTIWGLLRYNGMAWEQLSLEKITRIIFAANGTAWAGGFSDLIYNDGISWESRAYSEFYKNPRMPLVTDRNGLTWFANYVEVPDMLDIRHMGAGLSLYDGAIWKDFSEEADTASAEVSSAAIDAHGVVWFGTTKGLIRFDGNTWKTYTTADGLPDNKINAIAIGANGDVWIGTDNGVSCNHDIMTEIYNKNIPQEILIKSILPNPFNPSTNISFSLSKTGKATLSVYSVTGQKIRTLISNNYPPGEYSVSWDGKDDQGNSVSSGVYISCLMCNDLISNMKMLLVK